ncbi:MAG: tRNA (adenosine(37)-N6)-threonylcarbamoyltransferase complex ATPase subunit type 1 TsaE [Clostridia bacterium]|nr:tRNA (adenosine(37)-N6)-threonylcarbamoyltransferase complex ATPase subunit type 1 TsaE [Clostridia bacterium]MBQ2316086.1 tRNA (adenosine(37)-N6)-threonylcarbamoyltransferase complex ATPase subunit type 1 TsaE [Clostridia bacterium]
MLTFNSKSPKDTESFAEGLSKRLTGGEVIAFSGDLGMGKTCFVRGLARGLGFSGDVTSPTFAIINEYSGGRLPLYHFDMYRISGWDDLYSTGYFEYCEAGGVCAIEWSENIEAALPDDVIRIEIRKNGDTDRTITVTGGAFS